MSCDHSYQGGPYGPSMDDLDDAEEERATMAFFEMLDRISSVQERERWSRSID